MGADFSGGVPVVRIALLEDDPAQAELVQSWLMGAGHSCYHFQAGRPFLQAISRETFDLLVIDWGLPDVAGDEVLARVRMQFDWHVPVLFVTSRDHEEDIVYALQRGADDYMTKPVKRNETLARIDALIRRTQPEADQDREWALGPFLVEPKRHKVLRDGKEVELTQKEFDLTVFLFRNLGRLLSRGYILESVWATRPDLNTRTVDTHISRIRNKLGLTPENGWRLGAVYQHGYRLEQLPSPAHQSDS